MEQTDTLQQAIDTARGGNITLASRLLARYVTVDSKNETAWIWLAACLDDPGKRDYCLQKAHELNPQSPSNADELEEYLSREISPIKPAESSSPTQPIELPAPAVPVPAPDTPVEVVTPKQTTGMSRTQVTILVVLAAAIIIVLAVLAYTVFISDPGLLRSLFGG
jgi:hypothetical protein